MSNLRASINGPIMIPESTFDYLTVLSMPQVSFELPQIASLSRRRHGFDSRTGRQLLQLLTSQHHFAAGPPAYENARTKIDIAEGSLEATISRNRFSPVS